MLRILVAVLVLAVGFLTSRDLTSTGRTQQQIDQRIQVDCAADRDVATLPLTGQATPTALHLVADFRTAYLNKGCVPVTGPLPAPDPRVVPYLH